MTVNVRSPAGVTMTSREFNQDTARAKRAASEGPVFITDRGRPSHVLLSIGEFERLRTHGMSLADALHDPESEHIDFEPARMNGPLFHRIDFD